MSTIDLSRDATDFRKRYDGVRMQQGRVLTDEDFNEAARLDAEKLRRTTLESIGPFGSSDDGFLPKNVSAAGGRIHLDLSAGSLYLGGMRLELPNDEAFELQKDWLNFDPGVDWPASPAPGQARIDLVWIEAWQQPVTAIEDRELLEVALGGPDTTTRLRTMRRVNILTNVGTEACREAWQKAAAAWTSLGAIADDFELTGGTRLRVSFTAPTLMGDLCSPAVAGGYLGAENQAIRIQAVSAIEYVWGYDNGAPLYRALLKADGKIKLLTLPKDAVHWPLKGQVVEILPWSAALSNGERVAEIAGHLSKVATSYNPDTQELAITTPPLAGFGAQWETRADKSSFYSPKLVNGDDVEHFVYLRVWNRGEDVGSPAAIPLATGDLGLTGLSVAFLGAPPRPGDYWIVAARPAAPDVVTPWSLTGSAGAEPRGLKRYRAPLALILWPSVGQVKVYDCRPKFRPLTQQRCCLELVAKPGPGWEKVFDEIPQKGDAAVCFPPGIYPVAKAVKVAGRGRLRLTGAGQASRIVGTSSEVVVLFQNCDAVVLRDLHVHGGKPPQKALGGALSFQNVGHVELASVSVRCKGGRSRELSCVRVENAMNTPSARSGRVTVTNCEFYVGHLQIGLLVLNAQRIHIQGNRFVPSGPDVESVQNALRDERFQENLAQSALGMAGGVIVQIHRLDIPVRGEAVITFTTDEGLRPFWTELLRGRTPMAFNAQQVGLLRLHLMHRLKRFLGSRTARNNNLQLRAWLQSIDNGSQTVIGQAIVIGGQHAEQVVIEGNDIHDAAQGVHIGLSHSTLQRTAAAADVAGRVVVSQNSLRCVLCAGAPLQRHGIFIGNANSIAIVDNFMTLRRLPGVRHLDVDGIKLFGFLGEFLQVRSNHLVGFTHPVTVTQRGRMPSASSRVIALNFP